MSAEPKRITLHEAFALAEKATSTPQPAPTPGSERVLDHVMQDLTDRAEHGKTTYGTYLETHNGRDALQDAYEEALDLAMYLKQALLEREETAMPIRTEADQEIKFPAGQVTVIVKRYFSRRSQVMRTVIEIENGSVPELSALMSIEGAEALLPVLVNAIVEAKRITPPDDPG